MNTERHMVSDMSVFLCGGRRHGRLKHHSGDVLLLIAVGRCHGQDAVPCRAVQVVEYNMLRHWHHTGIDCQGSEHAVSTKSGAP